MSGSAPGLRERQAEQLRTTVLDAAIAALDTTQADDLSMADIADAAGISLRTLYRYFPDRASLLEAAGKHLYASAGVSLAIEGPEQIVPSFRDAARRLSERPNLVRALVRSRAGRVARSTVRSGRVDAIHEALDPLIRDLASDAGRRASAVITHLCSAASWVAVADESGISDKEAQEAVAWALDALLRALREGHRIAPSRQAGADRSGKETA